MWESLRCLFNRELQFWQSFGWLHCLGNLVIGFDFFLIGIKLFKNNKIESLFIKIIIYTFLLNADYISLTVRIVGKEQLMKYPYFMESFANKQTICLFFCRSLLYHGITAFQRYALVHDKLTACERKGQFSGPFLILSLFTSWRHTREIELTQSENESRWIVLAQNEFFFLHQTLYMEFFVSSPMSRPQ